jgi:hypothetical protein
LACSRTDFRKPNAIACPRLRGLRPAAFTNA